MLELGVVLRRGVGLPIRETQLWEQLPAPPEIGYGDPPGPAGSGYRTGNLHQETSQDRARGGQGAFCAIVHAADIQDRDGGLLVVGTLFGLYPFLLKLYAD